MHNCYIRRILTLTLCLMLAAVSASAEGLTFFIVPHVDPAQYSAELQPLMTGLSSILASFSGTLVTHDGSFDLFATLDLHGENRSSTDVYVYGLDSHWGVRSSLLGEQELMINNSALLAFGQKANDWLGIPLDKAALLVPYTHVSALQSAWEVVLPLFPAEAGKHSFTRAELDEMARSLLTLCDEDPDLNRWLETTGLYRTAKRYLNTFLGLPALVVPGMTVNRTANALTWDVYFVNILTIRQDDGSSTLSFTIPTLVNVSAALQNDQATVTGKLHAQVDDSILVDASCSLPSALPAASQDVHLTIDARAPQLPEEGFHLAIQGEVHDGALTLRCIDPDDGGTLLTLRASLWSFTPAPEMLPAYTPADLTGMNVLSVNGDSLRELMQSVRKPLLTGVIDLLVAAPPEAVQAVMDYVEDSGLLDLLADALSGGSGY